MVETAVEGCECMLDRFVQYEFYVGVDILLDVLFGDGCIRTTWNELNIDGLIEALARDFKVEAES